jgi:hypothetical protein
VKRIVEEHHGIIEACSDESGIRVRLVLPATIQSGGHHPDCLQGDQDLGRKDTVDGSQ